MCSDSKRAPAWRTRISSVQQIWNGVGIPIHRGRLIGQPVADQTNVSGVHSLHPALSAGDRMERV